MVPIPDPKLGLDRRVHLFRTAVFSVNSVSTLIGTNTATAMVTC